MHKMSHIQFGCSRWKRVKSERSPEEGRMVELVVGWVGQNGVGILRCHSEEFDKGGIFGGDQAT